MLKGVIVRQVRQDWVAMDLQELDLYDTQVSDEQVKTLRQALPNCEIFH